MEMLHGVAVLNEFIVKKGKMSVLLLLFAMSTYLTDKQILVY